MQFLKMQAAGNDFIVVEEGRRDTRDWRTEAVQLCDRHFGIGADGVLLLRPSDVAAFRMQVINPDGSEAEMCGNGIRCVAKYAVEKGLVPTSSGGVPVETLAGILTVWPVLEEDGRTVASVRVDMGAPELAPARIPVAVEGRGPMLDHPLTVDGVGLQAAFVSMGNPHAIVFLDTPVAEFPLEAIGPQVERHPLFPRRVNFEAVNVLARDRMAVRVWERGAGITLACGTGACASFVAAQLKGLVGHAVEAELPGGTLKLEWDGNPKSPVYMTGPVEAVFAGSWLGGE
jgi:diaminopimelate epimerase